MLTVFPEELQIPDSGSVRQPMLLVQAFWGHGDCSVTQQERTQLNKRAPTTA